MKTQLPDLPPDPDVIIKTGLSYWLFLDYDGTLADFQPTPDMISPDPQVVEVVTHLVDIPSLRVVILSGRRLDQTRAMVPVAGIFFSGDYGLEWFTPWGETIYRVDYTFIRPVIEAISPEWRTLVSGRRGFFLEDKGWSLALHARFADEAEAAWVLERARTKATQHLPSQGFMIMDGHRFLEVAPRQANKGEGVRFALERFPWEGAGLLYFGDDDKDEIAFEFVQERGGQAIRVGGLENAMGSRANFQLASPQALRTWLRRLSSEYTHLKP